jgi:hypothetical protein
MKLLDVTTPFCRWQIFQYFVRHFNGVLVSPVNKWDKHGQPSKNKGRSRSRPKTHRFNPIGTTKPSLLVPPALQAQPLLIEQE